MNERDRISFVGTPCSAHFQVRTLTLQPGDAVDYLRVDWAGALVVVERGELEVECASGTRTRFGTGSVLTFGGLPLRRLRNPGNSALLVSAISRAHR